MSIPGTLVSAPLCKGIILTSISVDICMFTFMLLGNEWCEFENNMSPSRRRERNDKNIHLNQIHPATFDLLIGRTEFDLLIGLTELSTHPRAAFVEISRL